MGNDLDKGYQRKNLRLSHCNPIFLLLLRNLGRFIPLLIMIYNLLNNITMSERSKVNRRERELKQEKQANRVVAWLAVILVALGVLTIIIASNS